jgi:hypothetical protein
MRVIIIYLVVLFVSLTVHNVAAQDAVAYERKVELLKKSKDQINEQEKEALKIEVEEINKRYEKNQVSLDEAKVLKESAAKKRALNIENRIAIIENEILLLERNSGEVMDVETVDSTGVSALEINIDLKRADGSSMLGEERRRLKRELKYDRRTYSDFVIAAGFNNALFEGQSLNDSPYKIGGSRFFEIGWSWRTRVFEKSNFVRLNYGFSFQFNGLKPKGNQYFVIQDGQVELQEFEYGLRKSKFRMDNLVFPFYLEFGPSKVHKTSRTVRYSLTNQFRVGIGVFGGFNMSSRQVLKYNRNGDKVKTIQRGGFNTNELIYGLNAYIGYDGVLLYAKYDLNPIFKNAAIPQNIIALGLRFDL